MRLYCLYVSENGYDCIVRHVLTVVHAFFCPIQNSSYTSCMLIKSLCFVHGVEYIKFQNSQNSRQFLPQSFLRVQQHHPLLYHASSGFQSLRASPPCRSPCPAAGDPIRHSIQDVGSPRTLTKESRRVPLEYCTRFLHEDASTEFHAQG